MAEPGRQESGKRRVLVVDDASLVRLYYREALEAAGFEVDEALNGLEALEKLLTVPADLLIVDVNMPHMDGFTFLRTLRRQAGVEAAYAAGANYYLVKPMAQDVLADHARRLSGRRGEEQR